MDKSPVRWKIEEEQLLAEQQLIYRKHRSGSDGTGKAAIVRRSAAAVAWRAARACSALGSSLTKRHKEVIKVHRWPAAMGAWQVRHSDFYEVLSRFIPVLLF